MTEAEWTGRVLHRGLPLQTHQAWMQVLASRPFSDISVLETMQHVKAPEEEQRLIGQEALKQQNRSRCLLKKNLSSQKIPNPKDVQNTTSKNVIFG